MEGFHPYKVGPNWNETGTDISIYPNFSFCMYSCRWLSTYSSGLSKHYYQVVGIYFSEKKKDHRYFL